jgi:hypothetical protein
VVAFVSALSLLLGSLHGTVMRGPITPVCKVGTPCDAPAKHLTLIFTRNGRSSKVVTDGTGRYRITLAPGIYGVTTNQRVFGRTPRPARVKVVANRNLKVDFFVDTGIR